MVFKLGYLLLSGMLCYQEHQLGLHCECPIDMSNNNYSSRGIIMENDFFIPSCELGMSGATLINQGHALGTCLRD